MNVMINKLSLDYGDCLATLKSTSYDDSNNIYMTESSLEVFDFDKVKEKYSQKYNVYKTPNSNDVLFFNSDDEVYFIEFKNGKLTQYENGKVKFKFLESILMFLDIVNEGLAYARNNIKYILVYNYEANRDNKNYSDEEKIQEVHYKSHKDPRVKIGQSLMGLANKEFVRFDLARYANIYVKEVHTYDVEDFKKHFLRYHDTSYHVN